ncbi:EXPA5 [Scenedesmus sp. PABB004]|nr:EXPA5 [Scenedesmus sp. PABB004]
MAPLLALLLLAAAALPPPAARAAPPPQAPGAWTQGSASFFGGPRTSAPPVARPAAATSCYGDLDPRLYPFYDVVGLSPDNPLVRGRPQDACGSCLEIECRDERGGACVGGRVRAVVTDKCAASDCNATNVNMHVLSFEQLAPVRLGRVGIRFRLVACEPADPITIHISGHRTTEGGWLRVAFTNVGGVDGALVAVEAASAGANATRLLGCSPPTPPRLRQARAADPTSPWAPLNNTGGASWELSGFEPPLDMRLTNAAGQQARAAQRRARARPAATARLAKPLPSRARAAAQVAIRRAIAAPGIMGDVETTAQFAPPAPADAPATVNGTAPPAPAPAPAPAPVPPSEGLALPQRQQKEAAARRTRIERAAAAAAGRRGRRFFA